VQRGSVGVLNADTGSTVSLGAGQRAEAADNEEMEVSGWGNLPLVIGRNGVPVGIELPPGLVLPEGILTHKILAQVINEAAKTAKDAEKQADKDAREAEKQAREAGQGNGNGGQGNGGQGNGGNGGPWQRGN
jgi:hypothetical protein